MRQAIHILKKDARYLWREIGLFLTLAALFGWRDYIWAQALLPVTAAYLIARLIHAEPLPGDTQFWLTRPYDWKSLLAAKLLFITIFLNVPIFFARLNLLAKAGFPLSVEIGPLLWSQFLMIVGFCLPIAALAALTADTMPFILSTLMLLVVGFVIQSGAIPFIRPRTSGPDSIPWPEGMAWIRIAFFMAVLIAAAIALLYLQYKTRQTKAGRILAAALLFAGIIGYVSISPMSAMELHTWFSRALSSTTQVQVTVGDGPRKSAMARHGLVQLSVPLDIAGLEADIEAHADGLSLKFEAAGGRYWETFTRPGRSAEVGPQSFDAIAFVDQSFFAAERTRPVELRGSLYMTTFKKARSTTVTLTHEPLNVSDGLQCFVNDVSGQLHCRSAFRWPGALVYAKVRNDTQSLWPFISYSPFPAGLHLNYLEEHYGSGPPPSAPLATIVVTERLAHIQSDFVIEKFNMEAFLAGPR